MRDTWEWISDKIFLNILTLFQAFWYIFLSIISVKCIWIALYIYFLSAHSNTQLTDNT